MKKIDLVLGLRCNSDCGFCFAHDDAVAEPPRAAILSLLDAGQARGYEAVCVSGGEPTISPLLPWVLDECRRRGLAVRLITNGFRLADPDYAADLLARGVSRLQFSLHGCDEKTVDRVNRRRGAFAQQRRALEALAARRPPVDLEVNCVITTDNVRALFGYVPFLLRHGVRRLTLSHLVASRDVAPELVPTLEESAAAARRVLAEAERTPLFVQAIHFPVCALSEWAERVTNHFYVDDQLLTNEEARVRRHHDDLRAHLLRAPQCDPCPHSGRRCAGFWRAPPAPSPLAVVS
ncbi:MAG: radical SAM protein [Planctomycetes bacterium]|nr:radical SAM protein [Planctomycetota bacterium]